MALAYRELRLRARALAGPPDPRIYWADLLLSVAVTWDAMAVVWHSSVGSPPFVVAVLVASLSLYRAAYFVHELSHQPNMRVFAVAWHLLVGVWVMIPAFMVDMHKDHHRRATYGTQRDPEYALVAEWSRTRMVLSTLVLVLAPPLLALRWAVMAPLSWLVPPLRKLTIERLSTLAINPAYVRPLPKPSERRRWLLQEATCFLAVWCVAALVVLDVVAIEALYAYWLVQGLALVINETRTLVSHAFERDGSAMTSHEQFLDTITLGGAWFTEITAPLGDRYHALHHMLPDVAYHRLGAIHRALLADPETAAAYRPTLRRGMIDALAQLWSRAERRVSRRGTVPVSRRTSP
jgi:fatty acid desaturase